jgi:hypothetical protein
MPFEMQTTSQTPMRAMQKRIRRLGFVTNHAIKKTIGFIKKTMGFISLISFFLKTKSHPWVFWVLPALLEAPTV